MSRSYNKRFDQWNSVIVHMHETGAWDNKERAWFNYEVEKSGGIARYYWAIRTGKYRNNAPKYFRQQYNRVYRHRMNQQLKMSIFYSEDYEDVMIAHPDNISSVNWDWW